MPTGLCLNCCKECLLQADLCLLAWCSRNPLPETYTFVTYEQVDSLAEEVIDQRLAMLEKRMNASNAQWKGMPSSMGHLANGLREHVDDL